MTMLKLTDQLATLKRVNVLGLGMALIGLSILLTPPTANASITNYVSLILGIDRLIIGGVIMICGVLTLVLRPYRGMYILCTIPWGLYCLGALFFEATNHLSATAGVAYVLIYVLMLREAFDLS